MVEIVLEVADLLFGVGAQRVGEVEALAPDVDLHVRTSTVAHAGSCAFWDATGKSCGHARCGPRSRITSTTMTASTASTNTTSTIRAMT